ncbi:MAG: uL22 family ribosomal protein [Candidatus Pacearchaeota archaeon]
MEAKEQTQIEKENVVETIKEEQKTEKKKQKTISNKPKKTEAKVSGRDLPISTKHAIAICDYIRGKDIETAIKMLEPVLTLKKAIPMKGEIGHRKGKMMTGRYPINAVEEIIKLLKSLNSNAIANELEIEKYVLYCKPNVASRPYKKFGRGRFKRSHVELKLILPVKKNKEKNKKN